jgi:hypothetical protein
LVFMDFHGNGSPDRNNQDVQSIGASANARWNPMKQKNENLTL